MNGMLYALGLELLIGKRGVEATKPVLWNTGTYRDHEFEVLESFVELEASNAAGEVITVRRYVAGAKDARLIEVIFGPVITGPVGHHRMEPFFVGVEGAAQRERGFHNFFSKFFDFQLPHVNRFKGDDVPLYVECIAPLMFIEQIRGWSGIQATLLQNFGIRNAGRLAVEYVLGLDVIENEKRRVQVAEEANAVKAEWQTIRGTMSQIASLVAGRAMNVPSGPVAALPDEPFISIPNGREVIPVADLLVQKRLLLVELSKQESTAAPSSEVLQERLEKLENQLLIAQAELSEARSALSSEEDEFRTLQSRMEFLKSDIQRNKDIRRLRSYGLESDLSVVHDKCPTCAQSIQDSLIPTQSQVMDVEQNIRFLEAEAEAVKLLLSTEEERLERLEGEKVARSERTSTLRAMIKDLRADLVQSRPVSLAEIRRQVHLQEEILRLEKARDQFDDLVGRLKDVAGLWRNNRAKQAELPDDYFSKADKEKLAVLSHTFAENVKTFGYRSTDISELHISAENYRPVCDEFEVAFGASASDNVRLIWAYTLALLQVSSRFDANHWGILSYDEPEQQKMKETSSDALYAEIAKLPPEECQVIIATSAPVDTTERRLGNLPHNLIEFGDKVIRPLIY